MAEKFPYPHQYAEFLAEYHGSRDFFECHEIMEEYWKQQAGSRYEGCWLVFVRISVACYHARRGNWAGARKLMAKAAEEADPAKMSELGLDGERLAWLLANTSEQWNHSDDPVYHDLDLPIADPRLTQEGIRICSDKGWRWGMPSAQADGFVIHKHLRRDRAQVVEKRRLSAEMKRRGRGQ
jgi:predicted metal-dependent hydrolase